jgi:hypothetical protein
LFSAAKTGIAAAITTSSITEIIWVNLFIFSSPLFLGYTFFDESEEKILTQKLKIIKIVIQSSVKGSRMKYRNSYQRTREANYELKSCHTGNLFYRSA